MTPQELKASILQLAIQGKLVPQLPEEGTGEALFLQIQAEKQRLIKAGTIKKEKPMAEIAEDEIPFDIPENWKWVCVQDLFNVRSAMRIHQTDWQTSGIPFFRGRELVQLVKMGTADFDIYISRDLYEKNKAKGGVPQKDDLLISAVGTLGKVYVVKGTHEFYYKDANILCLENIGKMYPYYVKYALDSPYLQAEIRKDSMATTVAQLTIIKAKRLLIPLPPEEEQKRIVAKIEELLPLIDRYEQAWSKLEDFNKRFPVDMQKSILQMAIQGKLVPQIPEEGTGEELFQQIQAEKQRLIKAGTIKKEKPLPEIAEDEIPFDIPESWKWVRLIDLCKSISDGDHQPPPQVSHGVPFLVISNVSAGSIDFSNTRYVPQNYFDALSGDRVAEKGDILFTVTGSYGIPIRVNCEPKFCFQRHIALLKLLIDWDYLFFALTSPVIKSQCDIAATGTAQKTVGLKSLRSMLIPLPPFDEQKRIVAKLEEILPLCERLK